MALFFNILLFIFLILFLFEFAQKNFKVFFLYGLLVFQAVTIVPSLIFIENGVYISEQGREGYFVGATLVYVLYFIITFLFLYATINSLNKIKPVVFVIKSEGKIIDKNIVFYVILIVQLLLLYNASQSKLPLFDSSVTRFTYWQNSKYPFLNKIFGNTSIFIPFSLGILYTGKRKMSVFLMMVYFGYNFLIGQKFSPIVSGLYSFFLPIVVANSKKINFKSFFNKRVLLAGVLIFSLAYAVIYKRYEQRRPYAVIKIYDPNEAMFYRVFGLQGHLMWGSVETYVYNNAPHSYNVSDFNQGMHKLMYTFGVDRGTGFDKAIASGFSFTNGYPSILFYVFPLWIALLLHIILTILLLGFMGWLLKEFLTHKAYLMAVITYQLFNWTIYAFTMGYFYKLKYPLCFIAVYAVYVLLRKTNKKPINAVN